MEILKSDHNRASSICEDTLMEILKGLSIKTLTRFQCVCKWWKSVISSTVFINIHHSLDSSKTPINLKPYIRDNFRYFQGDITQNPYTLYTPQNTLVEHLENQLHFPFRVDNHCVGVINGVICISYSLVSPFDSTVLWNPTIHKYVAVPRFSCPFLWNTETTTHQGSQSYAIGFGYDNSKYDFKVVRIWIPFSGLQCPSYEVYSAQQGPRKTVFVDKIKSLRFGTRSGLSKITSSSCFVNGTIHWLVLENFISVSMLMFDCESEELRTTEIPREILYPNPQSILIQADLLEYGGRLSALVWLYVEGGPGCIEMWVMEEDRTWMKLYRFRNQSDRLKLSDIDVYQSSLLKLAPYGPNQWMKLPFVLADGRLQGILSDHVYEKSMFLMDINDHSSYN